MSMAAFTGSGGVQEFYEYANREMLLPLLMVADRPAGPRSPTRANATAFSKAVYRKRYALSRAAIPEIQSAIGSDTFLLLKGGDYRHRLYDRPELRPMTDLDLLGAAGGIFARWPGSPPPDIRRNGACMALLFSPDHHEAST